MSNPFLFYLFDPNQKLSGQSEIENGEWGLTCLIIKNYPDISVIVGLIGT